MSNFGDDFTLSKQSSSGTVDSASGYDSSDDDEIGNEVDYANITPLEKKKKRNMLYARRKRREDRLLVSTLKSKLSLVASENEKFLNAIELQHSEMVANGMAVPPELIERIEFIRAERLRKEREREQELAVKRRKDKEANQKKPPDSVSSSFSFATSGDGGFNSSGGLNSTTTTTSSSSAAACVEMSIDDVESTMIFSSAIPASSSFVASSSTAVAVAAAPFCRDCSEQLAVLALQDEDAALNSGCAMEDCGNFDDEIIIKMEPQQKIKAEPN